MASAKQWLNDVPVEMGNEVMQAAAVPFDGELVVATGNHPGLARMQVGEIA